MTALQFLMNERNAPEWEDSNDQFTATWEEVAYIMDRYADSKTKDLERTCAELRAAFDLFRKVRIAQRGYFGSVQGTKARQEFLTESKALEKQSDKMIKSMEDTNQQKLF